MSNWTEADGYRTKTIQHGNATIIIHRPILSNEETARRERQVQDVLEREMRGYILGKEKKQYELAH